MTDKTAAAKVFTAQDWKNVFAKVGAKLSSGSTATYTPTGTNEWEQDGEFYPASVRADQSIMFLSPTTETDGAYHPEVLAAQDQLAKLQEAQDKINKMYSSAQDMYWKALSPVMSQAVAETATVSDTGWDWWDSLITQAASKDNLGGTLAKFVIRTEASVREKGTLLTLGTVAGAVFDRWLQQPARKVEQFVGFQREVAQSSPALGQDALSAAFMSSLTMDALSGKDWEDTLSESESLSEESVDVYRGVINQTVARRDELVGQGLSISEANKEATKYSIELQQQQYKEYRETSYEAYGELATTWAGNIASGETMGTGEGQYLDMWRQAESYAYTYDFMPERGVQAEIDLASGMEPALVYEKNKNPWIEAGMQILFDPNNIWNTDTLFFKGVGKVLGFAGKTVPLAVMSKIPGLDSAAKWLMDVTPTTVMKRAATAATNALDEARRFVVDASFSKLYPDDFVKFIMSDVYPEHFIPTKVYSEAIATVKKYLTPQMAETIIKKFNHKVVDDIIAEQVAKGVAKVGRELTEKEISDISEGVMTRIFYEGYGELPSVLREVQMAVGSAAKKAALDAAPAFAKIVDKYSLTRGISRAIATTQDFFVSMWLKIRPSWVIFNYSDNLLKGLFEGVNPFSNLSKMADRYSAYITPSSEVLAAIDELRKLKSRGIFVTSQNRAFGEALGRLGIPGEALGSFAENVARNTTKRSITDLPILKRFSEYLGSVAERAEKSFRARKYLTDFFAYMDTHWPELANMRVAAEINGATVNVSQAVDGGIRTALKHVSNPSQWNVSYVINKWLLPQVRVPRRATLWDNYFKELPADIKDSIIRDYDDLVALSNANGSVLRTELDAIRTRAQARIKAYAKELKRAQVESVMDSLPDAAEIFTGDAATLYDNLLAGKALTADGYLSAFCDMPAYETVLRLSDHQATEEVVEQLRVLREAGNFDEARRIGDAYYNRGGQRYQPFRQYASAQREVAERLGRDLESSMGIVSTPGTTSPVMGPVNRYLDASEQYTDLMETINEIDHHRFRASNSFVSAGLEQRAQELGLHADDVVRRQLAGDEFALIANEQAMAMQDLKRAVLTAQGKTGAEIDDLISLGPDNNYPGINTDFEQMYRQAQRQVQPMYAELDAWYAAEVTGRAQAVQTIDVTPDEQDVIRAYRDQMEVSTNKLVSDAQYAGIRGANYAYFDYETTNNLMQLMGNVFPFVRYPFKNYMYWLDKFSSVPRLAITVSRLRQVQAWYNRDLPEKYRYTAKVPFSGQIASVLGIDDETLRFNPWVFWSFASQMPGGNVFQMRELEEYWSPETKEDYTTLQRWNSVLESMGFSIWPYMEYAAQATGLLPAEYYVMDTTGMLGDVWKLVSLAFTGDTGSPDEIMRNTLPQLWNMLFANKPEWQWKSINKDMMEDYMTGKEISGIIMKMPEPEVVALAEISELEREEIIAATSEEDMATYRRQVSPVLEMDAAEQAAAVQGMTPEHKVAFWLEVEDIARRDAMKKMLVRSFFGHFTGIYFSGSSEGELAAYQLQMEKRREVEVLDRGPERRAAQRQFYEEHPQYGLIDSWRWGRYPYAETNIGYEMEIQNSIMDSAQSEYWEYNDAFNQRRDELSQSIYAARPGDKAELQSQMSKLYEERDAWKAQLNERTNAVLVSRAETFVSANGGDRRSAEILYTGFDTDVYVGTELSAEQKARLLAYKKSNPDDVQGYEDLFTLEWNNARTSSPPIQKRHIPGLDEGYEIHFEYNYNTHSDAEIGEYLVDEVIRELKEQAPQYDDFESYDEYSAARDDFAANLADAALELPSVQAQVTSLIKSGLTSEEAEKAVRSWYTAERLQYSYMANDTPEEALDYVADKYYYSIANDWYQSQGMATLYDQDPELYYAKMDEFNARFPALNANELMSYIILEYGEKFANTQAEPWTIKMLQDRFGDMVLPGITDRWVLSARGEKALDKWIDFYYNRLTSEDKVMVQEAFGEEFKRYMETPNDETSTYSFATRGAWLDALATATGEEDYSWKNLPGMEELINEQGSGDEKADFGLPRVASYDLEEYEEAKALDAAYWEYRNAGETVPDEILNSEVRLKWFGADTAKSLWWDFYYKSIPPGGASYDLRQNPVIQVVLDKTIRDAVATRQDYERALELAESWVVLNGDAIRDAGLDPAEYNEVLSLSNTYYDIPEDNKAARKQFLKDNPLLKKYLDARLGDSSSSSGSKSSGRSGGGGGGRSSSSAASSEVWTTFASRVGQSLGTVVGFLQVLWAGGTLSVNQLDYLTKLWESLNTGLTFDAWVRALKSAMPTGNTSSGSGGSGSFKSASKPGTLGTDFTNTARGFRTITR